MILLIKTIIQDLKNHGSVNIFRGFFVLFFNMSFRLILNYRLGNYLSKRRNIVNNIIILVIKKRQISKYNCDISYSAKIGNNIKFPHVTGIVIGEGVEIGNDITIWQGVTIGSHGKKLLDKNYPVISDFVRIYTDAVILGGVSIGERSIIAAKALVLKSIPSNSIAIGVPAKVKSI